MSTPESSLDQKSAAPAVDAVAALQSQVFILLIALIMVSGTFTAYLYRQTAMMGKELDQYKLLANNFEKNQTTLINFVNQLGAYGQTHPEFRGVLTKNGIGPGIASTPKR